jgi:hypothetical protein
MLSQAHLDVVERWSDDVSYPNIVGKGALCYSSLASYNM